MAIEELAARIAAVPTVTGLDEIARTLWAGLGAGEISDDDATALAEAVERRRNVIRCRAAARKIVPQRPSLFDRTRVRDRGRSRERRRRLATSGAMPSALACRFTMGELAALAIVAAEVGRGGTCSRTVGEIAARAGVGETTVRNAVRQASRLGMVTVEHRPRRGEKRLSNVLRITSPEWRSWIARRPSAPGCKKPQPTEAKEEKGFREGEGVRSRLSDGPQRPWGGRWRPSESRKGQRSG